MNLSNFWRGEEKESRRRPIANTSTYMGQLEIFHICTHDLAGVRKRTLTCCHGGETSQSLPRYYITGFGKQYFISAAERKTDGLVSFGIVLGDVRFLNFRPWWTSPEQVWHGTRSRIWYTIGRVLKIARQRWQTKSSDDISGHHGCDYTGLWGSIGFLRVVGEGDREGNKADIAIILMVNESLYGKCEGTIIEFCLIHS